MSTEITTLSPRKAIGDCLIVAVFEGGALSASTNAVNDSTGGLPARILDEGLIQGKKGQTLLLPEANGIAAKRVLLVGLGKKGSVDARGFRTAIQAAAKACRQARIRHAVLTLCEVDIRDLEPDGRVRHAVTAWHETLYRFDEFKSRQEDEPVDTRLSLLVSESQKKVAEAAVPAADAIALGQSLARTLGNRPGNVCTPSHLAEQARSLAEGQTAVEVDILERADMEKLGMHALLSVARGSRQPPKLIVMEYRRGPKEQAPIVLVGKGITFDSGGISIKPSANMDEMKFDMGGAAAVLGTMQALIELQLPLNVAAIIPSCENMPDGDANKPGDVVRSLSGQTIEVLNTDAEGRLILCDALTYAERFEPACLIDMATLTGACVVALGKHATGLFSNDDALAQDLSAAGEAACDRAWRLPLWEEYDEQLKSNFADMANIGGREAGAVTAACFLHRFAKNQRWAHLDIAGSAWKTGADKGGTGRPVPLLISFLLERAKSAADGKGVR